MEKMKMRFTNAVASKLSAAPHSTAKTELIEELSDNLYHRYLDMTAAGMEENTAFEQALDDLGDVDELLDYLKGLGPDEELPKLTLHPYDEEEQAKSDLDDILSDVDEIVKGAMSQAKSALAEAREAIRQAGSQKSSWRSGDGQFEVHFDPYDDDHGAHPYGEDHEDFSAGPDGSRCTEGRPEREKSVSYSFGYNKDKGGFFAQRDEWDGGSSDGHEIPSQTLRGIDIQTVNGDVTIHMLDEVDAPVRLDGDVDQLEVKVTDSGVLAIRQGKTASSSFFFLRGLSSADVVLYLPRRRWEFIQVSAVNGDVELADGFDLERLSVKTTSGSLTCRCAACGRLYFKSASGDLRAEGLTGTVQAETMSGDVRISGHMDQVRLSSMSGDVELDGSAAQLCCSSMSGDVRAETSLLPETLELSSKSGDCLLRIPGGEPFTIRYKTTSGEFSSDFPLTRTSGGAIYQGGGSRTFTITSISGDLELRAY